MRPVTITNEMRGKGLSEDRTIREVESHQTFAEAVAAIGTTAVFQLEIERIEDVAANMTVPDNIKLRFTQGGRLRIAAGMTLTIESPEHIIAGRRQRIFECLTTIPLGDGAVTFTRGGRVYPQWWNAQADAATDDTAAIQRAIDAITLSSVGAGTVFFPTGTYMMSNLELPPAIKLIGESFWHTILKRISGSTGNAIQESTTIQNAAKIVLRDFMVYGNDTAGVGINLGNEVTQFGTQGYVDNVMVRDFTGAGGTGFDINGNAASIGKISVLNCTTMGFILRGSRNIVEAVDITSGAGGAIAKGMQLTGSGNGIKSVYMEGNITLPMDIDNVESVIEQFHISIGNGVTITDLVDFQAVTALQNRIENIVIGGAGTATYVINDHYNGVHLATKGDVHRYDQGAGVTDNSIIYSSDASVTIPANGTIRHVILDNLTANRDVNLPLLPSGYPTITIENNSDIGNVYKVWVKANVTDAAKYVGGRAGGFPLYAQQGITLRGVDSSVASDKAWLRLGGQHWNQYTRQVDIATADILLLAGAPYEIIPAPGTGRLIEFISAVLLLDFGGTAFDDAAADGDLVFKYNNGAGQAVSEVLEADNFIDGAADRLQLARAVDDLNMAAASAVNMKIVLWNDGANFSAAGGGNGILRVIVNWREHNLLLL